MQCVLQLKGKIKSTPKLSPRSAETCQRLGISPEELVSPCFNSFLKQSNDKELAKTKYQRYEARREEKLALVVKEYKRVVKEGSLGRQTASCHLLEKKYLESDKLNHKKVLGIPQIEEQFAKSQEDHERTECLKNKDCLLYTSDAADE